MKTKEEIELAIWFYTKARERAKKLQESEDAAPEIVYQTLDHIRMTVLATLSWVAGGLTPCPDGTAIPPTENPVYTDLEDFKKLFKNNATGPV